MAFLDGAQSCTSFQTQGFKNKKKKKKLGSGEVWIELLPPLFWTFTWKCEPFESYHLAKFRKFLSSKWWQFELPIWCH